MEEEEHEEEEEEGGGGPGRTAWRRRGRRIGRREEGEEEEEEVASLVGSWQRQGVRATEAARGKGLEEKRPMEGEAFLCTWRWTCCWAKVNEIMRKLENGRKEGRKTSKYRSSYPMPSFFVAYLAPLAPRRGTMWASNEGREANCCTTSSTLLLLLSLVSVFNVVDDDEDEEEVEATRRAQGRRSVASSPTCPARH